MSSQALHHSPDDDVEAWGRRLRSSDLRDFAFETLSITQPSVDRAVVRVRTRVRSIADGQNHEVIHDQVWVIENGLWVYASQSVVDDPRMDLLR